MNKYHSILILTLVLITSCTKEVIVDIPEADSKLVIDGRIETGQPPIVLLTRSKYIYEEVNGNLLLEALVSGATVSVSDGTNTVILDEICSQSLPQSSQEAIASFLDIPVEELSTANICFYSTANTSIFGEVGKTYDLKVQFEGNEYTSSTQLLNPVPMDSLYWKEDQEYPDNGYSWLYLSDPPNEYNAYFWECKRINIQGDGSTLDDRYVPTFNPAFDDQFFNGLTFTFAYENPHNFNPDTPLSERGFYQRGDSVAIKFSRIDKAVYEFMEIKYLQLQTGGSPFATPSNLPTNISGGALGVWAGYATYFDTLYCNN